MIFEMLEIGMKNMMHFIHGRIVQEENTTWWNPKL